MTWTEYHLLTAHIAIEVCYRLRPDGSRASSRHRWRLRDGTARGSAHKTLREVVALGKLLAEARGEEVVEP